MTDAFALNAIRSASSSVPADAYYGIQTARAVENFPISGLRAPADLVTATMLDQESRGRSQRARSGGSTPTSRARSSPAADEMLAGQLRDQFVVDVYQAGAGTSHNMNANEVLANRAAETARRAARHVHARPPERSRQHGPVDQRRVPDGDAPGAAARRRRRSCSRARRSPTASRDKADEFADVLKTGRTHLQDAVPITLGQEFSGYAACMRRGADDVAAASEQLLELNIGATAVGTGLNAGDDYRRAVVAQSRALHGPAAEARGESVSRHAEHGRRARVFGRDAAARRRGRQRSRATCGC